MIRPDIISELEWQQHDSWPAIQRLLAQRTQSLYTEIQQLRDRLSNLQNTAMEMTDGRITRLSQYRPDAR